MKRSTLIDRLVHENPNDFVMDLILEKNDALNQKLYNVIWTLMGPI